MEVELPLAPHLLLMNRNTGLDVSTALREKAKGNAAQYRFMVQDISSGARLVGWLSMLSQSVTDISDTHFELLSALLSFDWFSRLPAEIAAYTEFLVHLTFAKPNFFEKIYTSMVVCFRGPPQISAASLEEKVTVGESDREAAFQAIHKTLRTLLEAHPTSVSVLRNVVGDKFPHKVFATPVQASYIKQLLFMTSYVPSLRKDALELIIDRIVQVDVCSSTNPHATCIDACKRLPSFAE